MCLSLNNTTSISFGKSSSIILRFGPIEILLSATNDLRVAKRWSAPTHLHFLLYDFLNIVDFVAAGFSS